MRFITATWKSAQAVPSFSHLCARPGGQDACSQVWPYYNSRAEQWSKGESVIVSGGKSFGPGDQNSCNRAPWREALAGASRWRISELRLRCLFTRLSVRHAGGNRYNPRLYAPLIPPSGPREFCFFHRSRKPPAKLVTLSPWPETTLLSVTRWSRCAMCAVRSFRLGPALSFITHADVSEGRRASAPGFQILTDPKLNHQYKSHQRVGRKKPLPFSSPSCRSGVRIAAGNLLCLAHFVEGGGCLYGHPSLITDGHGI